ncbi:TetR/AcrR family transcriptional regulator [Castellaniella caeni]|uniref:TetR/AcrR family transcriptional regulator n=1 Tax=Castellaniella caeni TaxID=266123 RepID=UPI002155E159|nr:TetR/AcrR family transcriptional regulator [Castellaniella caeni]
MSQKLSPEALAERRIRILDAARWCFLNFGYARTTLEDIARRAVISRTLLYRNFKDKEDIFIQVFDAWVSARVQPAMRAGAEPGSQRERLWRVCQRLVLDCWSEMAQAPMANEFHDVYERLRPKVAWNHREGVLACIVQVLEAPDVAQVFLLALEGLFADRPQLDEITQRIRILVDRFTPENGGGSTCPSASDASDKAG